MTYTLVLRTPTGERRVSLDRPLVVGRDPTCDLPVESARVSRRHAEFAPTPQGVSVRDLGSRNGVIVNGTRVEDALIGTTDRVLLGDVAITVAQSGAPSVSQPVSSPPLYAAAPGASAAPSPAAGPAYQPAPPPSPYAPPSWSQPGVAANPDKTAMLPRGAGLAMPLPPAVAAVTPGPPRASLAGTLGRRLGFGGRIASSVIAASVVTFLVTAIPLSLARNDVVHREAQARATMVVRAVATENGPALASGQTLAVGVQSAMAEPGVREVLVIGPGGRVLAPVERMDESISKLEPFGDLGSIQGLVTASVGNEIHAVASIESDGRHLGHIWLRLDPAYASAGAPMTLYIVATLLTALTCSAVIAVLLRRWLVARLSAFATDIDLAASGQIEVVTESFGLPRLAESVNFIVGRLRMAPHPVPPSAPAAPSPMSMPGDVLAVEREGRLVLDSAFMVTHATAGAAQILRTTLERLKAHHVLEAVADQAMVNAIIDGMGDVATRGSVTRRVEMGGGEPAVELLAKRLADGSIEVNLRRVG